MSEKPLSKKLVEDLGLIHIEVERLKKDRQQAYSYFFICMTIGCVLILVGINLWEDSSFNNISYAIIKRSSFLLFLGFGLCILAYRILSGYIKKAKEVKSDLEKINAVLDKYQIEYSCTVEFGKKYHGKQDVVVKLNSNSNLLKESKITYQV